MMSPTLLIIINTVSSFSNLFISIPLNIDFKHFHILMSILQLRLAQFRITPYTRNSYYHRHADITRKPTYTYYHVSINLVK